MNSDENVAEKIERDDKINEENHDLKKIEEITKEENSEFYCSLNSLKPIYTHQQKCE